MLEAPSWPRHRSGQSSRALIRVPRSGWSLWSTVCLRSAGFPVTTLLRLSSPDCVRLADRLSEERATGGAPSGAAAAAAPGRVGHAGSARREAAETFNAETRRIRGTLRELARQRAFREAVLWQNPGALRHGVDHVIAAPVDRVDSATKRRDLLVASYLQRYHAKNDTIGFFGPIGWSRFCHTTPAIALRCGRQLLAARTLYVESWCIDAIARALDGQPGLQRWRVPRMSPFVHLDGCRLMVGSRVECELPVDQARLLALCDGGSPAAAIARALVSARCATFPSEDAIYACLEEWRQAGIITWSLEGPRELRADRTLRMRLEHVEDPAIRERALGRFGRFASAIARVRTAAGDVDALSTAMEGLETTFMDLTGVSPTRSHGQTYAARTLVYEECRRDAVVELGADVAARLRVPLGLVLQGARWALHELARRHAAEFRRVYDQLAGHGRGPVSLGAFLGRTALLRNAPATLSPAAAEVAAALQERWEGVLAIPAGIRRIRFRSRDIRAAVRAAFETSSASPCSWARHVSPDVMIDAPSVEAIERGEYQLVLGELHPLNTLLQAAILDQHPQPDEIRGWLDRDCPAPRVVWIAPKETMPQRVHIVLRPRDFAWTGTTDPSPVPPERTIRSGDVVVADEGGALVVRTRDGRHRFTPLEFFGSVLMRTGGGLFHMLPPASHRPRVTIDDLVVLREQWQLPASEMRFATCRNDLDRYLECECWARDRGLPQFVFVKMPDERKPTYIDLSSPLFIDLLARFVRRAQSINPAARVTISEMLPGPDGSWLTDGNGERYTCELRMVAMDFR